MLWKDDWEETQAHFTAWWRHEGSVIWVTSPRDAPRGNYPRPAPPVSLEQRWLDPEWRLQTELHRMAHTYFGGDSFPLFDVNIGPGSLGTFLGSNAELSPRTVWYHPCIDEPEQVTALPVCRDNRWWRAHIALIEAGLHRAEDRFLVGLPDLIENLDTLAALRGTLPVLTDLQDRPAWVKERLENINTAFFEVCDTMCRLITDDSGGNAFCAFQLYGRRHTAKVQCDISALIGPDDFAEFVVPPLEAQCRWLANSMFHLDGSQCIVHLDSLLAIGSLDAIEFTPEPGQPCGGDPHWYGLYKRILDAGKSVQAINVAPSQVVPLLKATGGKGMYLMVNGMSSAAEVDELLRACAPYR